MICLGFGKILVSENLGRFCAIVVSTILSGMLEDSSRAHSGDILKANVESFLIIVGSFWGVYYEGYARL